MPGAAHRFRSTNALLIAATRDDEAWPGDAGPIDAGYLLQAAAWQGVTSLLHDWIGRHHGPPLGDDVTTALLHAYWVEHFRNRQLLEELRTLQQAAADAGVDVMAVKGAHLAPAFYPAPALRPLSDLDLIVREGEEGRLAGILRGRGFSEVEPGPSYVEDADLDCLSREHCWFTRRDGLDVLVEFRVAPIEPTAARLSDLDSGYRAALAAYTAGVWARSTPAPDGGRLMAPEDLLLQVATHMAAKHLDFRLIWLHDIARIVEAAPGLDWRAVAALADGLRVSAPVTAALLAARRYAGARIPPGQLEQVRATAAGPAASLLVRRDLRQLSACVDELPDWDLTHRGPRLWPVAGALSRVAGARARARVLRWVLFPGRAYRAQRAGVGRSRLTWLIRRLTRRAPARVED